jgi:23S rRNA (pseudouridine1915-N3)-methyltransferase
MAHPKVRILCVGKSREPWLKAAQEFYTERLKPYLQLEWLEVEDEGSLQRAAKAGAFGLDPRGRLMESRPWSEWLYQRVDAAGELTLLIGGPDGFSPALRQMLPPSRCLSLSPLTMTHQVVRVVLAEQLYRAALIHIGHPYHRD